MKTLLALCLSLPAVAFAATPQIALNIKDHRFSPEEVRVPAGTKVKLVVHNEDSTPEEFDSHQLGREKVITAGGTASIFIGPLKPGNYAFVGEFHEKTAHGVVIAE